MLLNLVIALHLQFKWLLNRFQQLASKIAIKRINLIYYMKKIFSIQPFCGKKFTLYIVRAIKDWYNGLKFTYSI